MAKTRPCDGHDDEDEQEEGHERNSVITTNNGGRIGIVDERWVRRRRVTTTIALFFVLTILALVQFRTFAGLSLPEWKIDYVYGSRDDDEGGHKTNSNAGGGRDETAVVAAVSDATSSSPLDVELAYLPWELDSIMNLNQTTLNNATGRPTDKDIVGGRCVPPPPSYNKMCCLGSSSAGGATGFKRAAFCAVGDGAYERVRVAAMTELNRGGSLQLLPPPSGQEGEGDPSEAGRTTTTTTMTTTCDVCRIMDLSLANNWTIGFTGDSVHHQVWDGFLCELSRNGYSYTSNVVSPDQGDNKRWRYGVKSIETVSIDVPSPWTNGVDGVSSSASGGETVVNGTTTAAAAAAVPTTATVTARYYAQYRPLEDMSELAMIASETDVLIFNFGVHWLRDVSENYEKTIRDVLSTFLHHRRKQGGRGGFALLATRETSAQHFANPGGEFSQVVQKSGKGCVEMDENDDDDEVFGWRERIVNRVADELGYDVVRSDAETLSSRLAELSGPASEENDKMVGNTHAEDVPTKLGGSLSANGRTTEGLIGRLLRRGRGRRRRLVVEDDEVVDANYTQVDDNATMATNGTMATTSTGPVDTNDGREQRDELLVLPFLNFTRGLRDLHKIGIGGDCTHFCSSPFLWSPLWRSLRLGMDYREERRRLLLLRRLETA